MIMTGECHTLYVIYRAFLFLNHHAVLTGSRSYEPIITKSSIWHLTFIRSIDARWSFLDRDVTEALSIIYHIIFTEKSCFSLVQLIFIELISLL